MAGCLLMMGLASCEMKNEILRKDDDSSEMGLLNLGVAVDSKNNDVQTKAEAGASETIPAVSATGYIVEISNSTGVYKTLTYDPTDASVELPVGDYTMAAHKPGDPTETEPYYGGSTSFSMRKNETTDVAVTCKMTNTKIQLAYSTEMQTSFTSWSITVRAGTRVKEIRYSGTEAFTQPDAFYWMLGEGVKEIKVSFVGKNKDNKDIRESRTITKPATAENTDWLGGDALAITMKPGEYDPEDPNGLLGIEISAEVTWIGINDAVDVPVIDDEEDGPVTPEEPGENTVEITLPQNTYTLPDELSKANDAKVTFKAKSGLASLKVIIKPGNDTFAGALSVIEGDLNAGVELIGNTAFEYQMGLVVSGITVPEKVGVTEYTFPLGAFFEVLNDPDFGATNGTGHVFKIIATAVGGTESASEELNIIVK